MLLSSLLLIPIIGVFVILVNKDRRASLKSIKFIALTASTLNFLLSLVIFILFDFSTNQFQFVQEYHEISYFDFYLGVDGLSIYFVLLTTIIIPISLLSNWKSISENVESYVIIILLLETLLLAVFLVLDILLFYIFFESILPPLFILIGIYGSDNRVKASFYLFLYTLLGSLFLLLSILAMSSIMSTTDFDTIFKGNFIYITQLFLFYGIFIAFAVKTPTIFLNTWLLKAHVESPLGGSIILAAIVLKLSLYGIFRLILPILPKAYMEYTYIIFLIGLITIAYASFSTLRTIDVKELIAYSSVSHAAVYLIGVFSNSIQGIEGGINLGLAHGLVSPGLFICAGGVLYDRSHSRLISFYKGMAQIMPLFAILFFILCLGNCGAPLTLNFVGEFMSLYGVFERSSLFGALASSSIVFSAAYTIYMYQRISFGGSYSSMFTDNIADLNKREFTILLTLVIPTVFFGIYTAPIMDGINYPVSTLIYSFDYSVVSCDASTAWGVYFSDSAGIYKVFYFLFLSYLVGRLFILGIIYIASSANYDKGYETNKSGDFMSNWNKRADRQHYNAVYSKQLNLHFTPRREFSTTSPLWAEFNPFADPAREFPEPSMESHLGGWVWGGRVVRSEPPFLPTSYTMGGQFMISQAIQDKLNLLKNKAMTFPEGSEDRVRAKMFVNHVIEDQRILYFLHHTNSSDNPNVIMLNDKLDAAVTKFLENPKSCFNPYLPVNLTGTRDDAIGLSTGAVKYPTGTEIPVQQPVNIQPGGLTQYFHYNYPRQDNPGITAFLERAAQRREENGSLVFLTNMNIFRAFSPILELSLYALPLIFTYLILCIIDHFSIDYILFGLSVWNLVTFILVVQTVFFIRRVYTAFNKYKIMYVNKKYDDLIISGYFTIITILILIFDASDGGAILCV